RIARGNHLPSSSSSASSPSSSSLRLSRFFSSSSQPLLGLDLRLCSSASPSDNLRLLLLTGHRTKITIFVLRPPPPIRASPRRCSSLQLLPTTVTVDTGG
ncbi:hypothetical protein LINGRAHAP2_LOCUS7900, partial [Linum grandiflorum]